MAKHNHKVGVIAVHEIYLGYILKQKRVTFTRKKFTENNVSTYSIEYPAIPKLHDLKRKLKEFLFKKIFKKYIQENGLPDIIHLHSFMNGESAVWIKNKYNIPYVITEHYSGFARNTLSKKDLRRAAYIFENADYRVAVSKQFSDLLQNKFELDFSYIPNIVNTEYFECGKKDDDNYFDYIHIAFLDTKKNQSMLINAFYRAFKTDKNIRLAIVGDGPEYNNLKNTIDSLGMQDQIRMYGRADREEVRTLLQQSDAFVLSSYYETFSIVVIEAMACGLPVIATKCGGPESIINSNKLGLLSDINEKALARELLKLYINRGEYDSKFIRQYTEDNFSEEAIVKKLSSVYSRTIQYMCSFTTLYLYI